MTSGPSLDRRRLERILAPWDREPGGMSIAVVDMAGDVLAGRVQPDARTTRGLAVDVVAGGEVRARVVASGPGADEPGMGAAVASLATALGELIDLGGRLRAIEVALREARAAAAAGAIGTDAAELAKGRQQQRRILSLVPPDVPGYELASHYAAAREIGGDFFELFRLHRRGRPLAMAIADVTGKGLDAALLMAFSRPVMHSALEAANGPADALERTNRVLVGERRGTLFITAIAALLEPRTGRIRIANAGHEPPLLVAADGGEIEPVGTPGVLLGAFATLDAPATETLLEPGDRLLFYTDGVTDARGPSGERFGDDRLVATLEAARAGGASDLVQAVVEAVATFAGATEPADDLTLVAIGRRSRGRRRGPASGMRPSTDAGVPV